MRIHEVKQCCCGCSLETGTKIIGWLQLICGIIVAISTLLAAAIVMDNESIEDYSRGNYTITNYPYAASYEAGKSSATVFIGPVVGGLFSVAFGLLLLIGASKRRPHLLKVWIVISLIGLVLYSISVCIQVVMAMVLGAYVIGLIALLISVCGLSFSYYYIMVVSSFRKEIMSGKILLYNLEEQNEKEFPN